MIVDLSQQNKNAIRVSTIEGSGFKVGYLFDREDVYGAEEIKRLELMQTDRTIEQWHDYIRSVTPEGVNITLDWTRTGKE